MKCVKITNERLWELAERRESIDDWLNANVDENSWREFFDASGAVPYRQFEFVRSEDAVMFALKWC